MAKDPLAEQSAKLLAALDFSAEAAAQEARHREELSAIVRSLLDVTDAFDRVLGESDAGSAGEEGGDDDDVPRRTVKLLAWQLARCREVAGIVPLPCLGETADPEVHEIAGIQPTQEVEQDTIVAVVSSGYLWNGRLLRRPRVIVAAGGKEKEQ